MVKTGYIYKLAIKDGSLDDCYIGSTSCIKVRKSQHKYSCNNENVKDHNYYVYQFIRDNGGFDNWQIYPLEKVTFEDKIELIKKEREYIEKIKPSLNKVIPTRTKKEYREDNHDKISQKKKEYHEANRDKLLEKKKEYRENNKEEINIKRKEQEDCPQCGKTMRKDSIKRHIRSVH